MVIVFIDNPIVTNDLIKNILNNINDKCSKKIIFISNYYFIKEKINLFGYSCYTVAEFLDEEDIIKADRFVEKICTSYYLDPNNNDLSLYKGISLGSVSEFILWVHIVMPRVRLISIINKIIKLKCELLILDKNINYVTEIIHCLNGILNYKLIEYNYKIIPHPIKGSLNSFYIDKKNNFKTILLNSYYILINTVLGFLCKGSFNILIWHEHYLDYFLQKIKNERHNWNIFLFDNKIPSVFSKYTLLINKIRIITKPKSKKYLLIDFNQIEKNIEQTNIFIYSGVDYKKLFEKAILEVIDSFYPTFILMIDHYWQKLIKFGINLILLYADSPPLNRALCLISKKLGIKSIIIQHGFKDYPNDMDMNYSDYAFVWSQKTIDDYLAKRNNQKKAFIVGNPLFEKIVSEKNDKNNSLNKVILILSHSFYNLSNYSQYSHQEIFLRQALIIISKNYSGYSILFKPHPSEVTSIYKDYIFPNINTNHKINIYLGNIDDAIEKSDIVICANSTAGIESYLNDKKVIVINITHRKFNYPFNYVKPSYGRLDQNYEYKEMQLSDDYKTEITNNSSSRIIKKMNKIL